MFHAIIFGWLGMVFIRLAWADHKMHNGKQEVDQ